MRDADRPRTPAPQDWNEAFAALPLEAPGADGWQRLTRALDSNPATPSARMAGRRRTRWPLWLAAAAVVSAAAVLPILHRDNAPASDSTGRVAVNAAVPAVAPASVPAPGATTAASIPSGDAIAASAPLAADATSHQSTDVDRKRVARTGPPARKPADTAKASVSEVTAPTAVGDQPAESTALLATTAPGDNASASTGDTTTAAGTNDTLATTTGSSEATIAALQAESARLEALVALARDERVASASGAALGVELDERIGRIDASLSQSGLGESERADLWQQRVETMRELAGIESTQRWLVTRGERYDGALVSVD